MKTWSTILIGGLLLTLLAAGGLLLHRRKSSAEPQKQQPTGDAGILYLLLWLAGFSVLAYIAFIFRK
jgi:hypothetical protein